ncbi:MAG: sigma-70 family RNA polymerase sigma factor [Planctomycetia bacterium]|nr:sigma-70 family RNA polymerase sigma factor [Planctomycetia bacterium]
MADSEAPCSRAPLDIAQLVSDYHQALYRYAYRLTGSVQDAEDLTQQVFLIAQQKLDQVRDAEGVRGWLFTVLRNSFLKSCRQPRPLLAASAEFDINKIPDDAIEQSIDSVRLQAAINALSDEFKIVILMFYFEHRPYRVIAELLDIPLGTVMSRLARAKANLRRALCEPAECEAARVEPGDGKESQFSTVHGPAVIRR